MSICADCGSFSVKIEFSQVVVPIVFLVAPGGRAVSMLAPHSQRRFVILF